MSNVPKKLPLHPVRALLQGVPHTLKNTFPKSLTYMAGIRVELGRHVPPFFSDYSNTTYVGRVQADFSNLNDPLRTFTGVKNIMLEIMPGSAVYSPPRPITFEQGKAYIPVERDFASVPLLKINFKIGVRLYYIELGITVAFDTNIYPLLKGTAITQGQEQLVLTSELKPEDISSSLYTAVFCITYQVNGEDFVLEHSLGGITPPPQGDDLIFPVDAIDGLRDIIATADSVKINGYLVSSHPEPQKMTVIPFAFG